MIDGPEGKEVIPKELMRTGSEDRSSVPDEKSARSLNNRLDGPGRSGEYPVYGYTPAGNRRFGIGLIAAVESHGLIGRTRLILPHATAIGSTSQTTSVPARK